MAKIGGNVVMIMMLLLVSIIIYYYMNTLITLNQCTFNLMFALFSTLCLKKTSRMFLAITRESIVCAAYSNSFFPRTTRDWNVLPADPATFHSADAFKNYLSTAT